MNLWRIFEQRRKDREWKEEIQSHLSMAIRERVERGETAEAAERAARLELGNPTLVRESVREIWVWPWLDEIKQDLRHAIRRCRKQPGLTAVIVASLALGMGANTAIFSLVYSVMLRSLPVERPEQLVELLQKYPNEPRGNGYWTPRSFQHYRDNNHVFASLTGTTIDNKANVRAEGSDSEMIAEYVAENYFSTLALQPILGRLIGPQSGRQSPEASVAVISWDLWHGRYRQDPSVLGKQIVVNKDTAVIVGVTPRGFTGLRLNAYTQVWLPSKPKAGLYLVGRLKPGVNLAQAQAEMTQLYRFTIEERLAGNADPQVHKLQVEVESARAGLSDLRDRIGKPLSVLMALVAALLLLACVNVAGLLLARGAAQTREMALRLGLGASRWRLVRQVLTESLLLSAMGTLAGGVIAYLGTSLLMQMLDSGRAHERVHLEVRPDLTLFAWVATIAVLTGIFFGLAPAWSASRHALIDALRQSGKALETSFQRFFARSLVAVQVAISMVLLSLGGLFVSHLSDLKATDLGFRQDRILLMKLDSSQSGYGVEKLSESYRELLQRLRALPGVRAVSLSAPTPLEGGGAAAFASAEGVEERPEDKRRVSISYVAPDYFQTLAIPLHTGREFKHSDASTPNVAVINQTLSRLLFANRNPVGQRVTLDQITGSRQPLVLEIIGVAGDTNYKEIQELDRRAIFLPAFRNGRVLASTFLIQTEIPPTAITAALRNSIAETVPNVKLSRLTTLTQQIEASIVSQRLLALLSGFFATLAALLAGIGLYGLLAFSIARRTNEIGIRVTLGASPLKILGMVFGEASVLAIFGLILGIPFSIWGVKLASALVPDLKANTSTTLAIGITAILTVAILAACMPARRAARVDPIESLRHD